MSFLSTARRRALELARLSGVSAVVGRSEWRRRRLCILCFHGIAIDDEHLWRPGLYLTRGQFRQRMESLARMDASVLPLDEALERLRAGTLPERAVTITFDDGCHDFHQFALPEIERHGFASTVYLTTYYSGRREPVLPLATDYLLWKSGREGFPGWPRLGLPAVSGLQQDGRRHALANGVAAALRGVTNDEQALVELLLEFGAIIGADSRAFLERRMITIMPPDEVLDASRKRVSIELHTHRHRTPRDRGLFLKEIGDNRAEIVRVVGRDPRHFCYPSGDVATCMKPWLEEAGVTSATTCEVALSEAGDDRFRLARFLDTNAQTQASFEGWVSGAAAFLSRSSGHREAAGD